APRRFRAWLMRIAQNAAIDLGRRDVRRKRVLAASPPAEPVPAPEEQLEREEQRQQVLAVLRSLPEEYRLPLTLRYLAGADYETIQMQMGLSNGSLRGLLHRGRKMMRAEMEKIMGELPAEKSKAEK